VAAANGIDPHDHPHRTRTTSDRIDRMATTHQAEDRPGQRRPRQPGCLGGGKRQPERSKVASRQPRPPAPSIRGPPRAAATEPQRVEETTQSGRSRTDTLAARFRSVRQATPREQQAGHARRGHMRPRRLDVPERMPKSILSAAMDRHDSRRRLPPLFPRSITNAGRGDLEARKVWRRQRNV
jgi:hypothetical protein